jgi:hypothetical protein
MAHSYWRVNVSAIGGGFYVQIAEVEMRATTGGADQCNGGTAIASVQAAPAGDAFDNTQTTAWRGSAGPVLPAWIGYHFTSAVSVTEYTLANTSTADSPRMPTAWTLEYSDDGTTWTVADTRTGQTGWVDGQIRTYTAAPEAGAAASARPQVFVCT